MSPSRVSAMPRLDVGDKLLLYKALVEYADWMLFRAHTGPEADTQNVRDAATSKRARQLADEIRDHHVTLTWE